MFQLQEFATELKLQIFEFMPLISLIRARCVCQEWRSIALSSNIHPIRRQLYDIYLDLLKSREFLGSREWVDKRLIDGVQERHQPFNRQAFIEAILKQHSYIPEDFVIWILEWPERAVIGSMWPNLPFEEVTEAAFEGGSRAGWNLLAMEPVTVFALHFGECPTSDRAPLEALHRGPVLPLWEGPYSEFATWLVLDEQEDLKDKVYRISGEMFRDVTGEIIQSHDDYEYSEACQVFSNWTEYLRVMLQTMNDRNWLEFGAPWQGPPMFKKGSFPGGDIENRVSRWAPNVQSEPLLKLGRKNPQHSLRLR